MVFIKKSLSSFLKGTLVITSVFGLLFLFSANTEIDKKKAMMDVIVNSLKQIHFHPINIDDEFSNKVYTLYLQRLDYSKRFLTQEDINDLSVFKNKLDDDALQGKYDFFTVSNDLIVKRIAEASEYYKEICAKPFDFTKDESYETDPEKAPFSANKQALKEDWRKYLKYSTLTRLNDMIDAQEKLKEKKDTVIVEKTTEQMEIDARAKVLKSMDDWFKRLGQYEESERYTAYLNCMIGAFDPHSDFFPPKEKSEFDVQMSGQFFGIGAQLEEKDGNIRVSNIIAGSASYRQGQLKAGDIILKVAQGKEEPVDIADMRLDKAVSLIRGEKGTEVRLTVKNAEGSIVIIPIVRDKVIIGDTYAKSVIVTDETNQKIGFIRLPEFYADFNGTGGRNCSEDMKIEVEKLKAEGVSGIIIDLRNNGGGSLEDVVKMAGLFIDKGPMVQVKSKDAKPQILEDWDGGVKYDGPLAIMVNGNSASASEIMAAAMQDYKRAVIVGSNSTFGKGSVQRFYDLDNFLNPTFNDIKPLGQIKITCQKFYRINGGATQLKGVIPDIILPDVSQYIDRGERELDYPMAWDEIPPAKYIAVEGLNYDRLKKADQARVKNNEFFKTIEQQAQKAKKDKENTVETLNLAKYREEMAKQKEENKLVDAVLKKDLAMTVTPLKVDTEATTDEATVASAKEWYKNLKKDAYLYETIKVVEDISKK